MSKQPIRLDVQEQLETILKTANQAIKRLEKGYGDVDYSSLKQMVSLSELPEGSPFSTASSYSVAGMPHLPFLKKRYVQALKIKDDYVSAMKQ